MQKHHLLRTDAKKTFASLRVIEDAAILRRLGIGQGVRDDLRFAGEGGFYALLLDPFILKARTLTKKNTPTTHSTRDGHNGGVSSRKGGFCARV